MSMNKIYIIMTALAVFSGASVASDDNNTPEKRRETSEVYENWASSDELMASRQVGGQRGTLEFKEEEDNSEEGAEFFNSFACKDAERTKGGTERGEARYSELRQYAQNVRSAIPHLAFTAVMGAFTFNEMTNRDGPDASLIPLSSMAILSGYHALQTIFSGRYTPYNIIPEKVRDAVRTGVSLVPGMVYFLCNRTEEKFPTLSQEAKICIKSCLYSEFYDRLQDE